MLETRNCPVCRKDFKAPRYVNIAFCSSTCEKAARKAVYDRECRVCKTRFKTNRPDIVCCSKSCSEKSKILYEKSEARKKYRHDYRQRPEVKAKKARSDLKPEVLKRKKNQQKTPKAREVINKRRKGQYKIPEVRQAVRSYQKDWYKERHR
jgi:hypothetical protein